MLALLFAIACQPAGTPSGGDSASPIASGSALITDLDGSTWFIGDPATGEVSLTYDLAEAHPDECSEPAWCMLYQARHRVAQDGRDEVIYTYSPVDGSDGDLLDRQDRLGRVVSVDADSLQPRWRLAALDFSSSPSGSACRSDPDDPCTPAADSTDTEFHRCQLYQPHDLRVVAEDADTVTLWIADTRNARMLRVRLPRTETCAVVEDAIGIDTADGGGAAPDWDVYNSVNSFEHRELDGGEELLMSIKDTLAGALGGQQLTGVGRGKIVLWRKLSAGDWHQVWEHPPASTEVESFVNAPHGVSWWWEDDAMTVAFAHSLGQASAWNTATGASVGVLSVRDDQPIYQLDADIAGSELRYSRDVHPLADGRLMITDTGCKAGRTCDHPTGVWIADLPALSDAEGLSGAWTADGSQQRFVDIEASGPRRFEDSVGLYSAEWIELAP